MKDLIERLMPMRENEGGGAGGAGDPPAAAAQTALGDATPEPKAPTMAENFYAAEDNKRVPDDGGDKGDGKAKEGEGDPDPADAGKKAGWSEYVNDPAKSDEENAAAKAEHDKTKPADPAGDKDKEKKADDDKGEAPKPEDYEIAPPEGFDLDPDVEKEFRETAAELKLGKDDVKKLTDLQIKLYEKQAAKDAETIQSWGESLKTHKEIGGPDYDKNIAAGRAAVREFFPDDARLILDKSGLFNHPDVAVGFVRIGKALGEGKTLTGNPSQQMTIVDAMYGNE